MAKRNLSMTDIDEDLSLSATLPKNSRLSSDKSSHSSTILKCGQCDKQFKTKSGLKKHDDTFHGGIRYRCPVCSDILRQVEFLRKHIEIKHKKIGNFSCLFCKKPCCSPADACTQQHIKQCCCIKIDKQPQQLQDSINANESSLPLFENPIIPNQLRIPEDPLEATTEILDTVPEHLHDTFRRYWHLIRNSKSVDDQIDHEYNFRWTTDGKIEDMISDIFEQERTTFRINAALAAILMHKETKEIIYFHSSENNFNMLDRPKLITTEEDRHQLIDELNAVEKLESVPRTDTKWVLLAIVNITFFVTKNVNFVAGCKLDSLPEYITRQHNNILTVLYNEQNHKYTDNLCFFRTLSQCLIGTYFDKNYILKLFQQYCDKKNIPPSLYDFGGVPFTDIEMLENLFKVNIQLFHLNEHGAVCWRLVASKYEKTLNLLVHIAENNKVHYCYIKNLNALAKRYVCIECGHIFRKMEKLNRHVKMHRCHKGETKHYFPGGIYKNSQTLFEELESIDIAIPKHLKQCEFLAVFDFETILKKVDSLSNEVMPQNPINEEGPQQQQEASITKTNYYNYHQPVSCAIQTNVTGFTETMYHVDKDPNQLTQHFITYLENVSHAQYTVLVSRYSEIFSQLDDLLKESQELVVKLKEQRVDYRREKGFVNYLKSLQNKLDRYCQQLTVVGFNSKKYDLNLIKRQLYPKLVSDIRKSHTKRQENAEPFTDNVIAEGDDDDNDYADDESEANVHNFFDIEAKSDNEEVDSDNEECNLDDEECNLDDEKVTRTRKPCNNADKIMEWPRAIVHNNACICLTTPKLRFLDMTNYLAPGSSLESFLNMHETELKKAKFPYSYLDSFERLSETCLPPPEAFFNDLHQESISEQDYEQCQTYWRENRMNTFGDYLMFYNKRDVEPFLEATLTMRKDFWAKFNIDIFRDVISLPGLTLRYLFNSITTPFGLFTKRDSDIYYKLKRSMVGGLSTVMTRKAEKDKTFIRNNPEKPVAAIVGLDANGLYLDAQGKPMPTGFYDLWFFNREGKFEKRSCSKRIAVEWLEMEAWTTNRNIQHQGNGKEKRIGSWCLPVDGWCHEEKTVYEFYGCYWHCHNCPAGRKNTEKGAQTEAPKWIKKKEEYITKTLKYKLIKIWECEWLAERQNYHWARECYDPNFFRTYQNTRVVSEEAMRKSIIDGSVFGFAEVDISTPDHLKELYADFPPIIKKAEIGLEHIGEHMREYAESSGQLKQPRTNLISTYSGKNIILMTPMIQFLVRHGLKLDRIHMVIQYDKQQPFSWFCDLVTENRLRGDGYEVSKDNKGRPVATAAASGKSKASALAADTFKLLGNTGYGKTITNKEKHVDTFYCDYTKAAECNLSPYVKQIKHITTDCYEVQMFKRKIQMNLPIVIGLATYSWAKIRMLSFAYDFLLKYLDKADYQWMETDTDSAYLALSHPDLRTLVKPHMRDEFEREYHEWFVDPDIPYTKRQPGLFKEEFHGTAMACLCAKTYITVDEESGKTKMSSKGLSHRLNKKAFSDYCSVLENKCSAGGQNRGFVLRKDNQLWTYLQERLGLSYLYIKRVVGKDGITTEPLDI